MDGDFINLRIKDVPYPSTAGKEDIVLMTPPPNVTGFLHLGHALNGTILDTIARFTKLNGGGVFWQIGLDHASISTQLVVERELAKKGIKRLDLSREEFLQKVWEWKEYSGTKILEQFKILGIAANWETLCFTMDDSYTKAVNEAFVRLFDEGIIYRAKRIVNWDTSLQTALSDLEVQHLEVKDLLYEIDYDGIPVATTRPETIFGDAALAVNPGDHRYQNIIGKQVKIPFTDRIIPVIASADVDINFGTGVLKVTPAHDRKDFNIGRTFNLPCISVLDHFGRMENVPEQFSGLDRLDARKLIVQILEEKGLLLSSQEIVHQVPFRNNSNVRIENLITDQWFVNVKELAEEAETVVENADLKFFSERWKNNYLNWLKNIEPWCISRQLWWGHRIPVWYDAAGNFWAARNYDEARDRARAFYGKDVDLKQEEDVLDTWFSSALWPFATLGWPQKTDKLKNFYPTTVLVTGFDIIFFWVVRMVMMGLKFQNQVPFAKVYIHGLIRDQSGQKMSKTKGNVIDPIDLIDKYGVDALRFSLLENNNPEHDLKFSEQHVINSRNFMTKIINAAKYIKSKGVTENTLPAAIKHPLNRWWLSELCLLHQEVNDLLTRYEFAQAARSLHQGFWDTFCSRYLEGSKFLRTSVFDEETNIVLHWSLRELLLLLHPLCPGLSYELWADFGFGEVMGFSRILDALDKDEEDLAWGDCLFSVIHEIRSKENILGKNLLWSLDKEADFVDLVQQLTKSCIAAESAGNAQCQFYIKGISLGISLKDSAKKSDVILMLEKRRELLKNSLAKIEATLSNKDFVAKANLEIIQEYELKQEELAQEIQEISNIEKNLFHE